eukprot:gene14271-16845_t
MNKSILIASLVAIMVAVAACQGPQIWSYCAGDINATFDIDVLTITPDPPKIGQANVVKLQGTLNQPISGGSATMAIQYFVAGQWRSLPEFQGDACSVFECPVAPGPFTFNATVNIPFITPRGNYRGVFQMLDQAGRNITCLDFATPLST